MIMRYMKQAVKSKGILKDLFAWKVSEECPLGHMPQEIHEACRMPEYYNDAIHCHLRNPTLTYAVQVNWA